MQFNNAIALDVGDKRIGIARVNKIAQIVRPLATIVRKGDEFKQLKDVISRENIDLIVIGRPRNMKGEETLQTAKIEEFARLLPENGINIKTVFQDESLTSVQAENLLKQEKRDYNKSDIDMRAACIILQDFLESSI